jgi:CheY-like chemotaxis protein/HPt (histidine-containing phosphotransfer) domain-containing protein
MPNKLLSVPQGARVLVVDDFAVNRKIVLEMLDNWNLRGEAAQSKSEALQKIHAAIADDDPYRLLLCDVTMPEGDGFSLVEQLTTENHDGLHVIMLTSGEQPDEMLRCRELGIRVQLLKPIKQSDLYDAITDVLGEHALPTRGDQELPTLPENHILLVEDSIVNQKLALGVLHRCGQRVTVANNGNEAIQLTAEQSFDLVLMDIQMPVMDGLEATRLIRHRERTTGEHVPIIAMTAHALTGDRERCLRAGMDEYLSKPVRPLELLEKIATVTGKALISPPLGTPYSSEQQEDVMPADPVNRCVNWEHALESSGGDADLLCELIDAYFVERPRLMGEIEQALATHDHELLHRAAHTIKSALRLFGYTPAQDIAFALEMLGQNKSAEGAEALRAELIELIERFEPELFDYLRTHRSQANA